MSRRPGTALRQDNRDAAVNALKDWCRANGGQVALARSAKVSEAFVSRTLSGTLPTVSESLLTVIRWTSRVVYLPPTITAQEACDV